MKLPEALEVVLRQAIHKCYLDVPKEQQIEEHGGWILRKDDAFEFHFLRNENAGTPRAQVLFIANKQDVGNGPLNKIVKHKWKNFATFHTHPQFSVKPSSVDWNFLFQNSKYNFIYSQATNQLGCSMRDGFDGEDQKWINYVWNVTEDLTFIKHKDIL